mmetsp:Transcript_19044/g.26790  ORF Transcript_19044/g.26790 Transcript_19044/m.26790 type:complete len:108 (+) Transcript_19044:3-326(+)
MAPHESPACAVAPRIVAHNVQVVHFCRILISIIAGSACGIIGYTGISGFLFFTLSWICTSVMFFSRTGSKVEDFFQSPWILITHDLFQGAMSFILFWTLCYDIVHIY